MPPGSGSDLPMSIVDWFALHAASRTKAWESSGRGDWMMWVFSRASGEPDTAARQRVVLAAAHCAALGRWRLVAQYRPLFDRCFDACLAWAYTPSPVRLGRLIEASEEVALVANSLDGGVDGHTLAAIGLAASAATTDVGEDAALYAVSHAVSAAFEAGLREIEALPICPGVLATTAGPAPIVAGIAMQRELRDGVAAPDHEFGHEVIWAATWPHGAAVERLLHAPCRRTLHACASIVRAHALGPPHAPTFQPTQASQDHDDVCRATLDLPLRVQAFALHCLVFARSTMKEFQRPLAAAKRTSVLQRVLRRSLPRAEQALVAEVMCHYFLWDLSWLISHWLAADTALVTRWRNGLISEFRGVTGRDPSSFMGALDDVARRRDSGAATIAAAARLVEPIVARDTVVLMRQALLFTGLSQRHVLSLQKVRDQSFASAECVASYFRKSPLERLRRELLIDSWTTGDLELRTTRTD